MIDLSLWRSLCEQGTPRLEWSDTTWERISSLPKKPGSSLGQMNAGKHEKTTAEETWRNHVTSLHMPRRLKSRIWWTSNDTPCLPQKQTWNLDPLAKQPANKTSGSIFIQILFVWMSPLILNIEGNTCPMFGGPYTLLRWYGDKLQYSIASHKHLSIYPLCSIQKSSNETLGYVTPWLGLLH